MVPTVMSQTRSTDQMELENMISLRGQDEPALNFLVLQPSAFPCMLKVAVLYLGQTLAPWPARC